MPKNIFNGRRMTDDGKSKYGGCCAVCLEIEWRGNTVNQKPKE